MAIIGAGSDLGGVSGSNAVARLLVVISGDSTPLQSALAKAEAEVGGFSKNASSIGNALTRNLSLPLLALAGLAVHAAASFETAFGKVVGLTPLLQQTGESAGQLRDQLLKLANDPEITAGPTDLANSLYLAGSAGLQASEVFPVVALSAKGMSVGMGDAATISTVLIAALNNYRGSGLTAAKAMDILTVAIKDGTAAPDQMAIALGRLLPVAAAAGVTFAQVTASVAALTNLGVPTRVATTGLRALFSELLAPTQAAQQRLAEFGITAVQLADTLKTQGPIGAFDLLNRAVHGNQQALHDIIPQIRGFTSFLGLTGTNLKSYVQIINDANHSTGAFQKALDVIKETPEFKFQVGLKELNIAAIKVGEDLIPLFESLAGVFAAVGESIGNLNGPMTALLTTFIVIGAVAGPVVKLFGELTATTDLMGAHAANAVPTFKAMGLGILTAGIAAIAAVGSFESLAKGSTNLISIGTTLVGSIIALKLALSGLQVLATSEAFGGGLLEGLLGGLSGGEITAIAAAIGAVVTVVGLLIGSEHAVSRATAQMGQALLDGANGGEQLRQTLANIKDSGIANQLKQIATQAHLMGKSTAEALPQLEKLVGVKVTAGLDELIKKMKDFSTQVSAGRGVHFISPDLVNEVEKYAKVINSAVANGTDLSVAFKQAGLSVAGYNSVMQQAAFATGQTGVSAHDLISEVSQLIQANKDYQISQQASIASTIQENQAVESLSHQTGVSVDYIKQKLGEYGVAAAGMSAQTQKDFLAAAAGVDKAGNAITLKQKQVADSAAAAAKEISDSLTSAFTLFGDLPKQVGNFDAVIKRAQDFSKIAVEEGAAIKSLLERGVPQGLIDQFTAQGPEMVKKFADATTPQLNKVVNAYEIGLGALDKKILEEAAHQEVKGKNMVQRFATSILGANNLTRRAGVAIVDSVAQGLDTGKVKPAGLHLIEVFVASLNSVPGLTRAAGSKLAQALADGLTQGDFISPKGKILVQKLADGIQQNSNLTKTQAETLAQNVAKGIDGKAHDVLASGHHLGSQAVFGVGQAKQGAYTEGQKFTADFARGMQSNLAVIDSAANAIANYTKNAVDKALQNSPYYFTLPMGRKLVTDLYEGVREESDKNRGAETFGHTVYTQFRQAFLNEVGHFNDTLKTLQQLVKSNMKKAFDDGDLEMVKSLEKIGKHLADHLQALQQRFVAFKQSIRQGFSGSLDFATTLIDAWNNYQDQLKQYADDMKQYNQDLAQYQQDQQNFLAGGSQGTAPTAPTQPTAPVAPNYAQLIAQQVADAQRFAHDLTAAAKAGLSQGLIQQFAGQGTAAAPILEALIANPQLLAQLNAAYAEVKQATGHTAEVLGEKFFGKAINHAVESLNKFTAEVIRLIKDLVDGLGDKNKKLIDELNHLLDALHNASGGAGGTGGGQGTGGGGQGGGGNQGGGGGTGGGGNVPLPPPRHTPVGTTPPIIPKPAIQTIQVQGDIVVNGMNDPTAAAHQIRSELIRIGARNAGKIGLTDK